MKRLTLRDKDGKDWYLVVKSTDMVNAADDGTTWDVNSLLAESGPIQVIVYEEYQPVMT